MRVTCVKPASPLGENVFFKNQSGKVVLYQIAALSIAADGSPAIPQPHSRKAARYAAEFAASVSIKVPSRSKNAIALSPTIFIFSELTLMYSSLHPV